MEAQHAIKCCTGCPLCKYTRGSKKTTIVYYAARLVQKICPCCKAVNRELGKNFQESNLLKK